MIRNKIPSDWLIDNINNPNFKIYSNINNYFYNMAEHQVSRKEKDFEWYKNHLGLDIKIKRAKVFIEKYGDILKQAENKHGIHYELITAILGIETGFSNNKSLGNFYVFSALISQYIFMPRRREWAVKELASLYKFSKRTNKKVYYFIGSFAGASGWAQFIPSSHSKYFIDAQNKNNEIDIYAIDDNIMSIENYLYGSGLDGNNIYFPESRYDAIFNYNPSDAYVQAVLYIYNALKKD